MNARNIKSLSAVATLAFLMGTTACSGGDNASAKSPQKAATSATQAAAPSKTEVPFQNEPVSMDKVNESNEKYACQKLLGDNANVKKLLASSETKFDDSVTEDWVSKGNGNLIGKAAFGHGQGDYKGYNVLHCTIDTNSEDSLAFLRFNVWGKTGPTVLSPDSKVDSHGNPLESQRQPRLSKKISDNTWITMSDSTYGTLNGMAVDGSMDIPAIKKARNTELMRRDKALFDYALQNVK